MVAIIKSEKKLSLTTRAFRNLSRRKIRALLVIIALAFSMAILIVIPAGIAANQAATQNETNGLANTINQTSAAINQTATEIQCGLTPSAPSGYGFTTSRRRRKPSECLQSAAVVVKW